MLAVAAAGPSAAAPSRSCAERGSTTARETSNVRVYETADGELIACSKRTGRWVDLAGPEDRVWELRVRGHYVAFAYDSCVDALGDDCLTGIDLVQVARAELEFSRHGHVPRVVLRRTGALAWSDDEGDRAAIFRRSGGKVRRLDRGPGVDAESLRLAGSTLEWRHGGARRTASLR